MNNDNMQQGHFLSHDAERSDFSTLMAKISPFLVETVGVLALQSFPSYGRS
jgi:hypothetical protein